MILFFVIAFLIIVVCCLYNYNLKPVDKKDSAKIEVVIPNGSSTKSIGKILKEKDLIKSPNFFYIYCHIYKINNLKATTYTLSKNMSLKEIVDTLVKGNNYNPDEITITFQEGINMRRLANIIEKNTNHKATEIMTLLKDDDYLDELIKKYWFITDDIKNKNIYYSLEGYLYPNTYKFKNKDVDIKTIFQAMLDEMNSVLKKYKSTISSNKYSMHQLLTLASIVEQEGGSEYRTEIASVIFNRLNNNIQIGSDATTYYAARVEMNERDLRTDEINDVNAYNTRPATMAGKLPVGPISNVSESSVKAVLYPAETDNYYFVADKYGKVYFTKTYKEHLAKIEQLKSEGAWYEW